MILITGAFGMLGSYIAEEFKGEEIVTLGKSKNNNIVCDLSNDKPVLGSLHPETVIHCAGTEDESLAENLNFEGTKRLCDALEENPPENFVFISSYKVYGEDAGEDVEEDHVLFATDKAGESKARAEEYLREWALARHITLTLIRPGRMFGKGVKGETLQLFLDATAGNYIHVRGVNSRLSLVCAYDVARGIKKVYRNGGVYNAADGKNPKLIEMVESMTANVGGKKRMTHLPSSWAAWIWRLFRFVPSVKRNLHPDVVAKRMKTVTLNGKKFAEKGGIEYFDTISVIERNNKNYPYKDE